MGGFASLRSTARVPSGRRRVVALAGAIGVLAAMAVAGPAGHAVAAGTVTLSGTVKDGSGHGWPLYATVTVNGGTVYTNPYTGKYSVTLPQGQSYPVQVTSVYPGYQASSQTLRIGTANAVDNVALPIDQLACTAPGYALGAQTGTTETFDGTGVPAGWAVLNNTAAGGWEFDDPHPRGNLTGGSGGFATVDSDFLGIGNTEDTYLVSPVSDFSGASAPSLSFNSDYHDLMTTAQVDLSIDGGGSWSTIWDSSGTDARGPSLVNLAIPTAAGQSAVQVRFHYIGTWAWWWQVDNVFLGQRSCGQVTGGLVAGRVTHATPAGSVVGATVTSVDNPSDSGVSVATPDDAVLGDGFYWAFSSLLGAHQFTASAAGYPSLTKSVGVRENATTQLSFQLTVAKVKASPLTMSRSLAVGGHGQGLLTIRNTGSAPATVTLGVSPSVSWLSLATTTVSVPKAGSVQVQVTFNAATADVTGPGTYTTAVTVTPDSGPAVPSIPITMTVH